MMSSKWILLCPGHGHDGPCISTASYILWSFASHSGSPLSTIVSHTPVLQRMNFNAAAEAKYNYWLSLGLDGLWYYD